MKIAYIILHYMAGKDTIECAESIIKATKNSVHQTQIVIIDNGSTNHSYEEIKSVLGSNRHIVLIHNNNNLGFAKGNNLGFIYAKYNWKADFIVQLNNDTIINQSDFNEVLIKKFQEKQYAVLGPDIITMDGYHQNPVLKKLLNHKELKRYRLKKYIKIFLLHIGMEKLINDKINKKNNIGIYLRKGVSGDKDNVLLHGACFIFSPIYIKKFDGMYQKTFLYWEEDILQLIMKINGYLTLYSSELTLFHKEDVSTNMIHKNSKQKNIWVEKQLISSSKVYEQVLFEMEQNQRIEMV